MKTRIATAALVAVALAVGMTASANASLLKAQLGPSLGYDSDGTLGGLLVANEVCADQAEVNVPVDEDTVVNICDLDDSECGDEPGCDTSPELLTAEFGTAPPVPVPLWPTGFGSDGVLTGPADAGAMLCQQTDPQRVDVAADVWVEICGS